GKPSAASEMWRHIAGGSWRAASEGDDPVHTEFAGKRNSVAQCGVMRARNALIRMEWITPAVEASDLEASSSELPLPYPAGRGLLEKSRHVAMASWRVGAHTDFESGNFRRFGDHPLHHLPERLACQRLCYQADLHLRVSHARTWFGAFQNV